MDKLDLYVSNATDAARFVHDAHISGVELWFAIGFIVDGEGAGRPALYLGGAVPDDFDIPALFRFMADKIATAEKQGPWAK